MTTERNHTFQELLEIWNSLPPKYSFYLTIPTVSPKHNADATRLRFCVFFLTYSLHVDFVRPILKVIQLCVS